MFIRNKMHWSALILINESILTYYNYFFRSGIWLDAADRVQSYGSKSLPRDARREPLGQDTTTEPPNHRVEDMLRWVTGVNNIASVQPVQERPLDLLPEG